MFNLVYYFLSGLRAEASSFFVFLLFNFLGTILMSAVFRSTGAASRHSAQAYAIAGITVLAMVMYTGFTLQTSYMHSWFRWLNFINPVAYIFEALLVNEVHGREFSCALQSLVPPYATGERYFACAVIGARPRERAVSGDSRVETGYQYSYGHLWRNLAIAQAYLIVFLIIHLMATELKSSPGIQSQQLAFRDRTTAQDAVDDPESVQQAVVAPTISSKERSSSTSRPDVGEKQLEIQVNNILARENVTLDITLQGANRRLLDNVTGWVNSGTLTCLMGASGAGKTTLLNTLAQRSEATSMLAGKILLNDKALASSFQRKMGYVQQQDLHLPISTVREALQFSTRLRQSAAVSDESKLADIEDIIDTLGMRSFGDAVIGTPGYGLNSEQRKLLTIGVELAAKPAILFLDEPTSGLDSQSAWTIISLLRKLADAGQAVLATIHQPSAMLFGQFDSLLLLAKGGRTTYFGPIGTDSLILTQYFERHGAEACSIDANPAEYILSIMGKPSHKWSKVWLASQECAELKATLRNIVAKPSGTTEIFEDEQEFALPFRVQFRHVLQRQLRHYWRSPAYIYAKLQFALLSSLFIGFTFFLQNATATGLQNTIFAIFMLNATFSTVVNQIMSRFPPQRALFEIRESPSKMYSWFVFVLTMIVVELPIQVFLSVIIWSCWYFAIFGLVHDATSRAMMWTFCLQFLLFGSTWAQMLMFSMPSTETAAALSTILFTLTLQFNGVLQPPAALPGFWIFMYRVSPFTYLIGGWAGLGLADRAVVCAMNELAVFDPPPGQSCGTYLSDYLKGGALGTLLNPSAASRCQYCPIRNADQLLASSWIYPAEKYRNMGIMWAYIVFSMGTAVSFYYVSRVRRFSLHSLRVKKSYHADSRHRLGTRSIKARMFYVGFYYNLVLSVLRNLVR